MSPRSRAKSSRWPKACSRLATAPGTSANGILAKPKVQLAPLAQGFEVNIGGYQVGHPPTYFWPYHKKSQDGTISQQLPGLEEGP